ncbi:molybdenum cofactor guanylyltransferase MobA [Sulfurimonas sp.]|uniref:molybdenum cofactor guanylyltransferase MobA n=1 Tax=Sulfurimonas sp. TaxID=2022749 RepID=UPI001A08BB84|nr:molybdenum cofactor guanylyltransferase MobA [Sulfurimonas sp.]MBE0515268.1 molybdenum cofactor guanylyltransferase MobA [Sulfurimonas sp.]
MLEIPCVIFAGGKSSRMGEDKALLPFGGFNTLAEFQFSRLSKIFKNVYISCKDSSKFNFEADFIEDIKTDSLYAPTAGFISAFRHLKCEKFFAISVDSPFIAKDEIEKIVASDKTDADATVAKTPHGIEPMCSVYHRSMEKKFASMLKENNHKLGFLLKTSNTLYVEFEDEKPFLNLNHPHEYQEALRLMV